MTEQYDEPDIQLVYEKCRDASDLDEAETHLIELLQLVRPRILRMVKAALSGELADLAEDVAVLVEVKLWQAVRDPRRRDLKSVLRWLVKVSKTTCIDEWKRQNADKRPKTEPKDPAEMPPERTQPSEGDPAEIVGGLLAAHERWEEVERYCEDKEPWKLEIARLTAQEFRPQEIADRLNEDPQYELWVQRHGVFSAKYVSRVLFEIRKALRERRDEQDGE